MVYGREVAAIVVAAGRSSRMGFDKMFYPINGVEVLRCAVNAMDAQPEVDRIVLVAGDNFSRVKALFAAYPPQKPLVIVEGGATRAASVSSGVAACPGVSLVAIHDGARPFVSQDLITRVLQAGAECGAAAPGIPVRDTLKRTLEDAVVETVPRQNLVAVQTPQVFGRAALVRALAAIPPAQYEALTDDCMVMERAGHTVRIVAGDAANRKITTPDDFCGEVAGAAPQKPQRVGHGYDVHRLVQGRPLILGGVRIEYEKGLLGHSDADVLLHAVADALLGAAALGDIGRHFPDNDPACKNADSAVLLARAARLVRAAGYGVGNIDATVVCQAPKLAPHIPDMCACIARAVGAPVQAVSVKATTEEGLGFTGEGQAVAAHCVALLAPFN